MAELLSESDLPGRRGTLRQDPHGQRRLLADPRGRHPRPLQDRGRRRRPRNDRIPAVPDPLRRGRPVPAQCASQPAGSRILMGRSRRRRRVGRPRPCTTDSVESVLERHQVHGGRRHRHPGDDREYFRGALARHFRPRHGDGNLRGGARAHLGRLHPGGRDHDAPFRRHRSRTHHLAPSGASHGGGSHAFLERRGTRQRVLPQGPRPARGNWRAKADRARPRIRKPMRRRCPERASSWSRTISSIAR